MITLDNKISYVVDVHFACAFLKNSLVCEYTIQTIICLVLQMFADLRCSTSCTRAGVHGTVSICPPDCFQYKGTLDVFYKIIRQVCVFILSFTDWSKIWNSFVHKLSCEARLVRYVGTIWNLMLIDNPWVCFFMFYNIFTWMLVSQCLFFKLLSDI